MEPHSQREVRGRIRLALPLEHIVGRFPLPRDEEQYEEGVGRRGVGANASFIPPMVIWPLDTVTMNKGYFGVVYIFLLSTRISRPSPLFCTLQPTREKKS